MNFQQEAKRVGMAIRMLVPTLAHDPGKPVEIDTEVMFMRTSLTTAEQRMLASMPVMHLVAIGAGYEVSFDGHVWSVNTAVSVS